MTEVAISNTTEAPAPLIVGHGAKSVGCQWRPELGHLRVLGRAGTGKTQLLWALADQIAHREWPVHVLGFRDDEVARFRGKVHVHTSDDPVGTLEAAHAELEHRRERRAQGQTSQMQPRFLLLDNAGGPMVKMDEAGVLDRLLDVLQHGAEVSIHVVIATTRVALSIDSDSSCGRQFTTKIVLGRISEDGAWMVWGDHRLANLTEAGAGQGIVSNTEGLFKVRTLAGKDDVMTLLSPTRANGPRS